MSNLTEQAIWEAAIYLIKTSDPVLGGENGTSNIQAKQLANRTLWLKQFADQVNDSKGSYPNFAARLEAMASDIQALGPEMQNEMVAALKFALTQAGLANHGVRALREQAQQEGMITIENRGVVRGCSVSKSSSAARNLNISDGVCFANGRSYSVADGVNAASVPSNTGTGAVVVHAYLHQDAGGLWRLAVTPVGTEVPVGAITIYRLTIPAGSTDATDPNLNNVSLTDVRRLEPNFPMMLDSPVAVMQAINMLSANDYVLGFDVLSYDGAPCDANHILTTSRAHNGFTITLASAADTVVVRWKASKLNN